MRSKKIVGTAKIILGNTRRLKPSNSPERNSLFLWKATRYIHMMYRAIMSRSGLISMDLSKVIGKIRNNRLDNNDMVLFFVMRFVRRKIKNAMVI